MKRSFDPEAILAGLARREGQARRFDIRIAADGTWYHEGDPIRRPELVALFASILHRDDEGAFWLVTPAEQGLIEVEDSPFTIVDMEEEGSGRQAVFTFTTNIGEKVKAGPAHPLAVRQSPSQGAKVPYLAVRGRLDARLLRPVYYRLAERALEDDADEPGIWSDGAFFGLAGAGD